MQTVKEYLDVLGFVSNDHDENILGALRELYNARQANVTPNCTAESIVRNMIYELYKSGFDLRYVDDEFNEDIVMTRDAYVAMKMFNESDVVHFGFAHRDSGEIGSVTLIPGNNEDVISDWSYLPTGSFNAVMVRYLDSIKC